MTTMPKLPFYGVLFFNRFFTDFIEMLCVIQKEKYLVIKLYNEQKSHSFFLFSAGFGIMCDTWRPSWVILSQKCENLIFTQNHPIKRHKTVPKLPQIVPVLASCVTLWGKVESFCHKSMTVCDTSISCQKSAKT